MRYVFGCAILCLGLSAAHGLPSEPFAQSSSQSTPADFTPSKMIEEARSTSTPSAEPEAAEEREPARRTVSRAEICDSVASAAQAQDLPIAFLASLVWQESRFNPRAVSPVGAQGIAQFMPKVAAAFGLADPFDPLQALPASAKFLRELYEQFGNLGLAAAAYNAGPKRVLDWMAGRGKLPAETRGYVVSITGRPAEEWLAKIDNVAFRIPERTPCQELASLPEWSSAGSGKLTPDLPVVVAEAPKPKPMIVITRTKVIVTGPQPKTLALKESKTKVAAKESKTKVAAAKALITVAQPKSQLALRSKAIVVSTQTKSKLAMADKKKFEIAQPKSIVAPEAASARKRDGKKTRLAEQDKKAKVAESKVAEKDKKAKRGSAVSKVVSKSAGKNPGRPVTAQRTAAART